MVQRLYRRSRIDAVERTLDRKVRVTNVEGQKGAQQRVGGELIRLQEEARLEDGVAHVVASDEIADPRQDATNQALPLVLNERDGDGYVGLSIDTASNASKVQV